MSRLLALLVLLAAAGAHADPGYYLLTPYDNEGLRTLEFRYWTVKPRHRSETTWPEIGVGWGVNSRWTSTLLASWIGGTQEATRLSTLNWQNELLLTQGDAPVDLALHLQWTEPQQEPGHAVEYGLLLKTELGFTEVNANLVFERRLGAGAQAPKLKLQWQLQRRIAPGLRLGLLGFDELGPWSDWSPHAKQSHRAGPAFSSRWPGAERDALTLQAAWLMGKTYGRSGHMFSLRAATDF